MKTRNLVHRWLGVGLAAAMLLTGCSAAATSAANTVDAITAHTVEAAAPVDAATLAVAAPAVLASGLTEAEAADLRYMREEEKLAHDVYLTLYELWGQRIFQNIAASEQTHTDAVLQLLQSYGIADPVGANPVGVFADPALQTLYTELVAQGRQSLSAALQVGAAIEELDILDLEAALAQTDKADIQTVYANLRKCSSNHLRSFVQTLAQRSGETYTPQYLSQAAYDAIIGGAAGRGGSNQGQRGNGRN